MDSFLSVIHFFGHFSSQLPFYLYLNFYTRARSTEHLFNKRYYHFYKQRPQIESLVKFFDFTKVSAIWVLRVKSAADLPLLLYAAYGSSL